MTKNFLKGDVITAVHDKVISKRVSQHVGRLIRWQRNTRFGREHAGTLIGTQSARGFAQKAGMGDSTLRAILNGAMPRLDNLLRISDAAGVSVEWLPTGKEPTKSDSQFEEEFALIPDTTVKSQLDMDQLLETKRQPGN